VELHGQIGTSSDAAMPKTRNSKGKGKEKVPVVQQPTPPTQDELSDSFDAMEEDTLPEKDSTELELEKLVFGDEKGFFDGLKAHKEDSIYPAFEDESDGGAIAESETEEQELDALEDADVSKHRSLTIWLLANAHAYSYV
jgi:hypothetical protein